LSTDADARGDLVRDRAKARRPLFCGDLLGALTSEQHHFVAHLDLVADAGLVAVGIHPEIDHQLVHRHGARNREAATSDEHLPAREPQVARHAIGVSDRDRRDASVTAQLVAQAVRQARSRRQLLHVGDARLERQRGP